MLTGFFSGISGMLYNQQQLDVTSHNLANVGTTGFRQSSMIHSTRKENPFSHLVDSAARKRYIGSNGTERLGVFKSFEKTGQLQHTGDPMDLGIVPELKNAFFAVQRSGDLSGQRFFTRNGKLSLGPIDPTNMNSPTVLHAGGHPIVDLNGQPIQIDPSLGPLKVRPDGFIYQGDEEVAELPLYRLNDSADPTSQNSANLSNLRQLGDSLLQVPEHLNDQFHAKQIRVGEAGVTRLVNQGSQEASNVNIFHEMMDMMSATKGASSNMKAISDQIGGLTKLFELVRR